MTCHCGLWGGIKCEPLGKPHRENLWILFYFDLEFDD